MLNNIKFRILLIVGLFMVLVYSANAQSQTKPIIIKNYIIVSPQYFQGDNRIKFRELPVILKPNPVAYNLILDAKKTRNWGLGINGAAIITFTAFWVHVLNVAANNTATAVVVPILIDEQGLILMASSFGLLLIGKSLIKISRNKTKNSIKVYNDGVALSANFVKFNLGITQNGIGFLLKF